MRSQRVLFVGWMAVHLSVAACAPVPPAARPPPPAVGLSRTVVDALDRLVDGAMARHEIPGMSLAIARQGRVVHVAGYGLARRPDRAAAADTIYRLGSISKTFTAVAALQLAERGALDLDAPVQEYVPTFPVKLRGGRADESPRCARPGRARQARRRRRVPVR